MEEYRSWWVPQLEHSLHNSQQFLYLCIRIALFFDSVFRGVGQVVFADNPISGMIIAGVMIGVSPWTGICALFGTIASTFMAEVLHLDYTKIRQGLFGMLLLFSHQTNGKLSGCSRERFSYIW
jgi:urea transporter